MELHAVDLLYDFAIMSALMLVAKIIRVKVKVIQDFYIPTALIAGFLGLLLGKQFLNVLPFSGEIGNYSGILIAILFGSMFLGNKKKESFRTMLSSVGDTFFVNGAAEIGQYGVFVLIGVIILPILFPGIHEAFGMMLPSGFIGGHGTAAAVGTVVAEAGWSAGTSVGQTFATIGLLSGIVGGVILINIGARKGYTKVIKEVKSLPEEMKTGLVPEEKRISLGDATVNSMSIEPLTWHLGLVLVAVGLAYLTNTWLKVLFPQVSFPVYGLALLCSIALQAILKTLKMEDYVDKRVITHIGSSSTDYLVAFGVASINISIVLQYWLPIVLLSVLGLVFVVLWHFVVSKRFFKTYWYERGLYIFGMSTGVLATGVILLRILDPEFESGVLEDFGFAWIFLSIVDMLVVSLTPMLVLNGMGVVCGISLVIIASVFLALSGKIFGLAK